MGGPATAFSRAVDGACAHFVRGLVTMITAEHPHDWQSLHASSVSAPHRTGNRTWHRTPHRTGNRTTHMMTFLTIFVRASWPRRSFLEDNELRANALPASGGRAPGFVANGRRILGLHVLPRRRIS